MVAAPGATMRTLAVSSFHGVLSLLKVRKAIPNFILLQCGLACYRICTTSFSGAKSLPVLFLLEAGKKGLVCVILRLALPYVLRLPFATFPPSFPSSFLLSSAHTHTHCPCPIYMCVLSLPLHLEATRRQCVPCSVSLCLSLFRQGLFLNLELGCQLTSPH